MFVVSHRGLIRQLELSLLLVDSATYQKLYTLSARRYHFLSGAKVPPSEHKRMIHIFLNDRKCIQNWFMKKNKNILMPTIVTIKAVKWASPFLFAFHGNGAKACWTNRDNVAQNWEGK